MNKKSQKSSLKQNERGLAAIVVTVFVMIMISLVVLAFSQVSRREQRQSLDRQLSTQAFYAAEAGINNIVSKIDKAIADGDPLPVDDSSDCSANVPDDQYLDNPDLGTAAYSCVQFDREPKSLEWGTVSINEGEVTSLHTKTSSISTLKVKWVQSGDGVTTNFAGCAAPANVLSLPADGAYDRAGCTAGMLRVMLFDASSLDRNSLVDNMYTVFFRPVNSGASVDAVYTANPGQQGGILPAVCSSGMCEASIVGLPSDGNFYAHIRSLYTSNKLELTGTLNDPFGAEALFDNSQIMVDSTGRAQDVVKRLQVRIPITEETAIPGFSIAAMNGICKRLNITSLTPPFAVTNSGCDDFTALTTSMTETGTVTPPIVRPPTTNPPPLTTDIGVGLCSLVIRPPWCGTTGVFTRYNWVIPFVNKSPAGTYVSCTWEFSNGQTRRDTKCQPEDVIYHDFRPTPLPPEYQTFNRTNCNRIPITVRLTVQDPLGRTATANYTHYAPNCG